MILLHDKQGIKAKKILKIQLKKRFKLFYRRNNLLINGV